GLGPGTRHRPRQTWNADGHMPARQGGSSTSTSAPGIPNPWPTGVCASGLYTSGPDWSPRCPPALLTGEGHDVVDVDAEAGDGPDEVGVTEGEDPTVATHHPVALAGGRGHDADDVGDVDVEA